MVVGSKKFEEGDRVICVKDTPAVQESWIGTVVNAGTDRAFPILALDPDGETKYYFAEDELEILSAGRVVIRQEGLVHNVEIKGTLDNESTDKQSALDKQVSGNHYKDCGIQPIEYIHANNLSYLEGNVIKYTTRHSKKNGKQDILKAIHYLELILEMEYKGETN